jgi:hypothetical protein
MALRHRASAPRLWGAPATHSRTHRSQSPAPGSSRRLPGTRRRSLDRTSREGVASHWACFRPVRRTDLNPDRPGTTDRRPRRLRSHQQGDCRKALPLTPHRERTPLPHLLEARHHNPRSPLRCPRRTSELAGMTSSRSTQAAGPKLTDAHRAPSTAGPTSSSTDSDARQSGCMTEPGISTCSRPWALQRWVASRDTAPIHGSSSQSALIGMARNLGPNGRVC